MSNHETGLYGDEIIAPLFFPYLSSSRTTKQRFIDMPGAVIDVILT